MNWKAPRNESLRRAIENNELLVAELKGKVVGFIHLVVHEDIIDGGPNAFITAFYVTPRLRNKGIGSALLQRTLDEALNGGCLKVETSTTNQDARHLYERYSFEQFRGEVFLELDVKKYPKKRKRRDSAGKDLPKNATG